MCKVARWMAALAHRVGAVRGVVVVALAVSACTGVLDGQAGPRDWEDPDSQGADADIDSETFQGPIVSTPLAATRFVRLSHRQWENTVRDLLRLPEPLGLSRAFVAEPLRGTFDTNGSILTVSQDMSRDYQLAAEKVANLVARDRERLAALAPEGSDPATRARDFVASFGLRAFRRPLGEPELSAALDLFEKGPELVASGDDFADGVELVVSYLLQAPSFLYRAELSSEPSSDGKIALGGYELATRLSYALTNSMPDDALFAAAAADELRDASKMREHARRLLALPGARETVTDFHAQLLHIRDFEHVSRNGDEYPGFGEGIGPDLTREALTFVEDVVFAQGLGLEELLTAPYTFANARIAGLYGLPAQAGAGADAFVRVELDPTQRAGLLTQLGFLSSLAEGSTPNIIMRGVNVARRLLCVDLPPPPNMIPMLPAIAPDGTNRERVQELTGNAPCSSCHTNLINPLGFALETLDGVGRHRTSEANGRPIDAASSYTLDGKTVTFDGPVQLAQRMAESVQAHDCYARHWVEYLYGRELTMKDRAERSLVKQAGAVSHNVPSLQNLLVELVTTEAFTTRSTLN